MSKILKNYIKSYKVKSGERFKVILPDGHGFQIREQGFLTFQDALNFANQKHLLVLSGKNKSSFGTQSKTTFSEFAKEFIEIKKREQVEEVTILRYSDQIKNFLNPFFGHFKLAKIEKHHLRNYIQESYDSGITTYNAWSTVSLFKMMIRKAIEYDYAVDERVLLVKTPKHKAKDPVFWGVDEVNYFLNVASSNKRFLLWKLTLFAGLRAGEAAALKWDAIHENLYSGGYTGFISVRRSRSQKTKVERDTTKNGEHRMIPMAPQAKQVIEILKERKMGDYLFGGDKPLDTSHWARDLQREIEKHHNLPRITFHQLRHSCCSYMEATGLPRRIVSAIMGHLDPTTTNRYSHVNEQMLGSEFGKWIENQSQQNSSKKLVQAV